MPSSNKTQETPNQDTVARTLAERAVSVVREGLRETSDTRMQIFRLMMAELTGDEIRALVHDVGFRGIMSLVTFLRKP